MTKRRLSSLLPACNQTDALVKFFGSTVDQVFQPGTTEQINAYIGRISSNENDTGNDFYVAEPTTKRRFYQLESGMVSYDATQTLTTSLVYPDLVTYLDSVGGITTDESRLFETNYYSWAPPIDIDKLINYQQYYWFGDENGATDLPTLTISAPIRVFTGDGITTSFPLPSSISGVATSQETPQAYVNGATVAWTKSSDENLLILAVAPVSGSQIVTTRLSNLAQAISGQPTFPLTGMLGQVATYYGDGITTAFPVYSQTLPVDALTQNFVFVDQQLVSATIVNGTATLSLPPFVGNRIDVVTYVGMNTLVLENAYPFDAAYTSVPALSSNMRVRLVDASGYFGGWDVSSWETTTWDQSGDGHVFFVDGVGQSIRLTPDSNMIRGFAAQYVTIDRSSLDQNTWSRRNNWVHGATFAWSTCKFTSHQATRPIIEFVRDIVLYDYGSIRIPQIDCVISATNARLTNGHAIPVAQINGQPIDGVLVDNGITLRDGVRLLIQAPGAANGLYVVTDVDGEIDLVQQDYSAGAVAEILLPSGFGPALTEVFFNGTTWVPTQVWNESVEPLFMLYDVETVAVALNDASRYPGSNFTGSRVFGYTSGSGVIDPILKRSLSYDKNGYIMFNADVRTVRYTCNNGPIVGLYCYGIASGDTITSSSVWHKVVGLTSQAMTSTDPLDYGTPSFYQIPLNLQANPLSSDVTSISRSLWVNHFAKLVQSQVGFTGALSGDNNWRDTSRDLTLGTEILQHQTTLLKAMLLASNFSFDYFAAIRFVDQEYTRLRNKLSMKLVSLRQRGQVLDTQPALEWINAAFAEMIKDKSTSFPFALSNMAGVNFFIPPTPAFLGILPSYVPALVTDTSYINPVLLIRGHDGSETPAFNDWRDNIFLAFENLIYANIPSHTISGNFNPEARLDFDLDYWRGGRFFQSPNGYTLDEVNQMLAPIFARWAEMTGFNYSTNSSYISTDPFTWNYHGCVDSQGNSLPGSWRAIYRWYFDTDRPHITPWEMLGFTDRPSWWQEEYGTSYARNNTKLWGDLELGTIRQGIRQGNDPRYARPGLSGIIPVDNSGTLLDPIAARIVPTTPIYQIASSPWVAGDYGPAENLWFNSPSYRFALAQIAFMMKPARLVDVNWNSYTQQSTSGAYEKRYGWFGDQWVDFATYDRPSSKTDYVHGEMTSTGKPAVVIGIQQWISDSLVNSGLSPSVFGNAIRGIDVRLIHKMAGFVSSDGINIVADSFGLLPAEDTQVMLYQSPAVRTEVYSGIIVEWTGSSYRVLGYDARNPSFTVLPPDVSSPRGIISLATTPEPVINPWGSNVYYKTNTIVSYNGSNYLCLRSHTSGTSFESSYWTSYGVLPLPAPKVNTYLKGYSTPVSVPYGTNFNTLQQVADFLLGWERYLVSRGWTFTDIDATTNVLSNWSSAVYDFLVWSQTKPSPGNFVALSPAATDLNFVASSGTVLNVEDAHTGFYGMLDRSGRSINKRNARVSRLDGNISLKASNADIFGARLSITEVEHALVFSNISVFDDVVYMPLFNLRQARLRFIGNRTMDWAGRLDAPGYIIIGSTLESSFEKNAEDVRLAFDIELSDRTDFRDHARHLIGYQKRDYMNNLLLSDTEQFEFYQGMIQDKGSPGVFDKLLRSQRVNANSDIVFLEEWAFRVSRFGAPLEPRITMLLNQGDIRRDPQVISFSKNINAPEDWIVIPQGDPNWLDAPTSSAFFPTKPSLSLAVQTAGPVRLNEVQYTSFNPSDLGAYFASVYQNALTPFLVEDRVWVYETGKLTWDVWRLFELGTTPNTITKVITLAEDPSVVGVRLVFASPIGLTTADVGNYIVIDGSTFSTPDLGGVQTISAVNATNNWVEVSAFGSQGYDFTTYTSTPRPSARIFRSVRFANQAALTASTLTWSTTDLVWLDDDGTGRWSVCAWRGTAWTTVRNQPDHVDTRDIVESLVYVAGPTITGRQIIANEPVINSLTVIDPLVGAFPGVVAREIDYKSDVDPACYNGGYGMTATNVWGQNEVGRVWWDMSTVRYIDPYTDVIGKSPTRDIAELNYRATNWGQIAPNTSVDIYEWTQSTISPLDWTTSQKTDTTGAYTGTVYQASIPSWVETVIFNPTAGKEQTVYFFWVKDRITTPPVTFRKTSIATVARILANPSTADLPWMAAIAPSSMVVSGVAPFLNGTNTVIKVQLRHDAQDQGHDQWELVRQNDALGVPPEWLWRKFRDGLAGFDDNLDPVPSPELSTNRNTGIFAGQNVFTVANSKGPRGGIVAARQSLVGMVNQILAAKPVMIERPAGALSLDRTQKITKDLTWNRVDTSYSIEPPPVTEYQYVVYSARERDRLLATPDFINAVNNPVQNTNLRVLINSLNTKTPQWSIWQFNATQANTFIGEDWTDDVIGETLVANANQLFTIAQSYDYSVEHLTDRNALLTATPALVPGNKVLVQSDENADGFWTVYIYDPTNKSADSYGFVLYRVQAYDTTGFYSVVDWYAQNVEISGVSVSYSANNPPMVQYPNTETRDRIEGKKPTNLFVRITNPTNDSWIWTAYDTTFVTNGIPNGWTIVARQNGTIALSSSFYDSTRAPMQNLTFISGYADEPKGFDTIGYNELDAASLNVTTRDGSWELRILMDVLLHGGLLLDLELNQIMFSLLHFIHTQQYDVDWAFKTSFMTIAGYAVPLTQPSTMPADITSSMTAYVNEIKPYHVKIRDYQEQYSGGIDSVDIHATDFDNPVYLDPLSGSYRPLVLTTDNDQVILGTSPWVDWYTNYNTNESPIRQMKITLRFDRVTGQEYGGFGGAPLNENGFDASYEDGTGTAIDRITQYYSGTQSIETLMNLGFKGQRIDGWWLARLNQAAGISDFDGTFEGFDTTGFDTTGTITQNNTDINGGDAYTAAINAVSNTDSFGYGLRDPYVGPNRPEERVVIHADDGLQMKVVSGGIPGAPTQIIKFFDTSKTTALTETFFFDLMPSDKNGVLVWLDGNRAINGVDYTVDQFARTATVNLDGSSRVNSVLIHVFGFGGSSPIIEQDFFTMNGSTSLAFSADVLLISDYDVDSFDTDTFGNNAEIPIAANNVSVIVNGVTVDQSNVTVNGLTVSLSAPPSIGDDVALLVYEGSSTTACRVNVTTLGYVSNQQWSINDIQTVPEHAGTIVEVDGLRMLPPLTFYGKFDISHQYVSLIGVVPNSDARVVLYVNNAFLTSVIPIASRGISSLPFGVVLPSGADPHSKFAFIDDTLVSLDLSFRGDVCVVIYQDHDYEVANGTLTILKPLSSTNSVTLTTFRNAQIMGIRTFTYPANTNGDYFIESPVLPNGSIVTLGGAALALDVDYQFTKVSRRYDATGYDQLASDDESVRISLTAPVDPVSNVSSKWLVATIFTGAVARLPEQWMTTTTTPAALRMAPILDTGGFSDEPFGDQTFDTPNDFIVGVPRYNQVVDRNGNFVPVAQYAMNNSWERNSTILVGCLASDLSVDAATIVVNLAGNPMTPKLWADNPLTMPDRAANHPGVIWVGAERIEYWDLQRNGNLVTIGSLRRGTYGTSQSQEHRIVSGFIGDDTSTVYNVSAIGQTDVFVNGVRQRVGIDYTIAKSSGTTITFGKAKSNGAIIRIGITSGLLQPAGTEILRG